MTAAVIIEAVERSPRAWTRCPACDGSTLQTCTYTGEPTWCRECSGNGTVRARDANGRFIGGRHAS